MARSAPLSLTQLEAREVPSAAMFADIRSGVWGSYPLNLTPSGGALFFSADNGHGYEFTNRRHPTPANRTNSHPNRADGRAVERLPYQHENPLHRQRRFRRYVPLPRR